MTDEQKKVMDEYAIQVKLHINKRLYDKGLISQELYDKAKGMIIKTVDKTAHKSHDGKTQSYAKG